MSGSAARKRSSRTPASDSGTRSLSVFATSARVCELPFTSRSAPGANDGREQDHDAHHDKCVREIEGRPVAHIEKVGHVAEPQPVEQVRGAAADQKAERDRK